MEELMATSSQGAYDIPKSAAPRAPAPVAVHCWPVSPQETFKHSSVSVSVGSLGPGVHNFCLSPLSVSGGYGVWFSMWFCPSYCLAEASPLPFDVGYLLTVAPVQSSHKSNFHLTLSIYLSPPSTPPPTSIGLFSTSVSPLLPWKLIHQYHLLIFHIYASVHGICISLSDLLHSV